MRHPTLPIRRGPVRKPNAAPGGAKSGAGFDQLLHRIEDVQPRAQDPPNPWTLRGVVHRSGALVVQQVKDRGAVFAERLPEQIVSLSAVMGLMVE